MIRRGTRLAQRWPCTRLAQRLYCSSPPIAVPSLGSTPKTADGAKQLYDEWASTYDAALESWGYPVPPRVAEVLTSLGQTDASRILDLGCGTGLSGAALRTAGLGTKGGVVGTDISNESLEISRAKGLYADVCWADLEQPLPFDAESFDAIACVGVLSYVQSFDSLFPELARVLKPHGVFVTSHRTSLWDEDERGCQTAANALVAAGAWTIESIGAPEAYMPNNPDPIESAKTIRLLVFRRTSTAL
jgi:SAM-dependent methyltransferase